ncbi:MAG: tetratricopeptide repeat protein [Halothermotrichaceae bacterium]
MKRRIMFCVLLLLGFIVVGGSVLAENELEADLNKVDNLFNNMNQAGEEKALKLIKKAVKLADNLVEKYPDNPRVYWMAASSYSNLSYFNVESPVAELRKGKMYAEKSIEIAPDRGRGYFWLGTIIGQIGQEEGIMKSLSSVEPMRDNLEKALKLDPDFAPAYDVMGRLYTQAPGWPLSIGDDEKAVEYRKKAVELKPDNLSYQWALYNNYLELDREKEAIHILKRIIIKTKSSKYSEKESKAYRKEAEKALKDLEG